MGSITDTLLFFSISFYATDIPWLTLALGDLAVKLLITLIMLIPFRILLNKIKDYSGSSVSVLGFNEKFFIFTNKSVNWFIMTSPKS